MNAPPIWPVFQRESPSRRAGLQYTPGFWGARGLPTVLLTHSRCDTPSPTSGGPRNLCDGCARKDQRHARGGDPTKALPGGRCRHCRLDQWREMATLAHPRRFRGAIDHAPLLERRNGKGRAMTERLYLYDTTLRDGQQTQGVQFSTKDKVRIATALDELGLDYIEGGWPGANPTDSAFFEAGLKTRATMTAFGMTKRAGRSAANDEVLAGVVNAGTPAVCLVGKSHDFHVTTALGITLEENVENVRASFQHVAGLGRETLFDAEHFFDGYKSNPDYALEVLRAAYEAGCRWIVLCDTNGGTLPHEVGEIVTAVIAAGIPGDRLLKRTIFKTLRIQYQSFFLTITFSYNYYEKLF